MKIIKLLEEIIKLRNRLDKQFVNISAIIKMATIEKALCWCSKWYTNPTVKGSIIKYKT